MGTARVGSKSWLTADLICLPTEEYESRLASVTPLRAEVAGLKGEELRLQEVRVEVANLESKRKAPERYGQSPLVPLGEIEKLQAEYAELSAVVQQI